MLYFSRKNWVHYRNAQEKLSEYDALKEAYSEKMLISQFQSLLVLLHTKSDDPLPLSEVKVIFDEWLEGLLAAENTNWTFYFAIENIKIHAPMKNWKYFT